MAVRLAYFCRGNGFGHAARSIPILESLRDHLVDAEVRLYSGTGGVEYLRRLGYACEELGWTDVTDHGAASVRAVTEIIEANRDTLEFVVADELHYVPLICARFALPSLLLTCRLATEAGAPEFDMALAMRGAKIIVPDWIAAHTVPDFMVGRAEFTGPLVRVPRATREQARVRLNIESGDCVAVVAFGSVHPLKADVQRLMLAQALQLWRDEDLRPGRLLVLCDEAQGRAVLQADTGAPEVEWLGFRHDVDDVYSAADVVLASAGTTVLELARHRVPVVAFCPDREDIPFRRLAILEEHGLAVISAVSPADPPSRLHREIDAARHAAAHAPHSAPDLVWASAEDIARQIGAHLHPVPTREPATQVSP